MLAAERVSVLLPSLFSPPEPEIWPERVTAKPAVSTCALPPMPVSVIGMPMVDAPFDRKVPPPKLKLAVPSPLVIELTISVPPFRLKVPLLPAVWPRIRELAIAQVPPD